jgi:hypothetical protein
MGLASGGSGSGLSVPGGVWSIVLAACEESVLPPFRASAGPIPANKMITRKRATVETRPRLNSPKLSTSALRIRCTVQNSPSWQSFEELPAACLNAVFTAMAK